MAFTYDAAESSTLHQVRGKIGDVETPGHYLEDATISALLSAHNDSVGLASVQAVRRILAKIARRIDRNHPGGMNVPRSQLTQHYRDLLVMLEAEALMGEARGSAGGISIAANTAAETNTDRPKTKFKMGMMSGGSSDVG